MDWQPLGDVHYRKWHIFEVDTNYTYQSSIANADALGRGCCYGMHIGGFVRRAPGCCGEGKAPEGDAS